MEEFVVSRGFRLAIIYLIGSSTACAVALLWLPSAYLDGHWLPTGHDSFYHARRILDAVHNPAGFYELDPLIHAPKGGWITWPWGYDLGMARLTRLAMTLPGVNDPMQVLLIIPPLWTFVNAALLLAIASELELSLWMRLLVVLGFALSPLTQDLHGAGHIDHHFVEQTAVLAALFTGLRWLRRPGACRDAALFGAVLGAAPVLHSGLFLLQLPVVCAMALLWVRGLRVDERDAAALAAGLIGLSFITLLLSQPFRAGFFTFYLYSWFHLYIACATAAVTLTLSRLPRTQWGVAGLVVLCLALVLPLLKQLLWGLSWMHVSWPELQTMPETKSALGLGGGPRMSPQDLSSSYSALVWLLPVAMLWNVASCLRDPRPARVYFHLSCLFGTAMLLIQFRFHHYGSFALWLLPPLALQESARGRVSRRRVAVLSGLLPLCWLPGVPQLWRLPVPGYAYAYVLTRNVYPLLASACASHPGVVLADHNDGHFVRFHTDCAVIGNNLIMTPQDKAALRKGQALLELSPQALRRQAPWIDYVLVRRNDNVFDTGIPPEKVLQKNAGLRAALLLGNGHAPGYELLRTVRLRLATGRDIVLARLYRVHH